MEYLENTEVGASVKKTKRSKTIIIVGVIVLLLAVAYFIINRPSKKVQGTWELCDVYSKEMDVYYDPRFVSGMNWEEFTFNGDGTLTFSVISDKTGLPAETYPVNAAYELNGKNIVLKDLDFYCVDNIVINSFKIKSRYLVLDFNLNVNEETSMHIVKTYCRHLG